MDNYSPGREGPTSQGLRLPQILSATLDGLRTSLTRQVPAGALREYWLWGLDPATPQHAEFVQAIGARQLCRLTETLLDGLVTDDDWPTLTPLTTTMNVYQLFEIVSDNLAIGGQRASTVLRPFNTAMAKALRYGGAVMPPAELLAPIRPATRWVSGFTHSLAGAVHHRLATAYTRGGPVADVEYGLWPALVGNMTAAVDVAAHLSSLAIGPTLRHGLVNRYLAVNRTLDGHHLPLFELAAVGAQAILVLPTLSFYLGALAEILHPDPAFAGCVADGTLPDLLNDAALLVRLLNDIGTGLLTGPQAVRQELWERLRTLAIEHSTMDDLVCDPRLPPTVLTRLRKDIRHGEFNVALHAARLPQPVTQAVQRLASGVDYFAALYALHSARMTASLAGLRERLTDTRPLALVERFVRFHEQLYARPYTDTDGEYAI